MAHMRTRQTKDGPRYDVRYLVNGKEHSQSFRSQKDADARLIKVRADELAGLITNPQGGERLFGDYADRWLDDRLVKGRPLTPMTRFGYEGLLRRNLRPTFGKTKLRQITPERVRTWFAEVTRTAGADQAAKSYRLLRAIMTTAETDDLIAQNPCRIPGAGIEHAEERPMLDTSTVAELANAIDPRFRCLVLLGGFMTLRTGELCGLRRKDVDLLHRTLHVRQQAQEISGHHIVTEPKTQAGIRSIPLPAALVPILADHLDTHSAPGPDGSVFVGPTGLTVRRRDISAAWRDALEVVGVSGLRVHDLRHHAATVYARKPDVTLKELMTVLGHASPAAALRYQHATEKRSRELADYMDGVISSADVSPAPKVVQLRSPKTGRDGHGMQAPGQS